MRNRREAALTGGSAGGTTLISSGTTVKGDITFTGQLDVEGSVVGSIQAESAKMRYYALSRAVKCRAKSKYPTQRSTVMWRAISIPVND